MGPLVSEEQVDAGLGPTSPRASTRARRWLVGGDRPSGRALGAGFFVQPTVLTDVDPSMRIMREEIFGPVAMVSPFATRTRRSRAPTTRPSASPPASGHATSSAPTGWPPRWTPGPSGSTPTACSTPAIPYGGFAQRLREGAGAGGARPLPARPRPSGSISPDPGESHLGLPPPVSFCESLRAESGELWEGLHEHPFIRELAAGTLSLDSFRFFLEQDQFFLPELARAVALGAAGAADDVELRHFAEELEAVVVREAGNNEELLRRLVALGAADQGGARLPAPATVAYSGFLVSTATLGGSLEIMAALLPCTWSYADIAVRLERETADHPVYAAWVGFFASDDYVELIAGRRLALDRLVETASAARKRRLSDTFTMAVRLEALFWTMAYEQEQWPDLDD